jgi:UDP-N-acetylmuramyl-tripeptide synthetase
MLRCKKHTFLELKDVLPTGRITGSLPERDVSALTLDSREVVPDSVFFAVTGGKIDASMFIESAFRSGALVVVSSKKATVPESRCLILVDDVRAAMADVAVAFSQELLSELTIVGVTGTNGKTTTAHMINSILQEAHRKSAFIGTTGVTLPDGTVRPVTNTTPDILSLLSIFQELFAYGIDNFVIEVSSQGVVQKRVRGIPFRVGVFTNLTPEHMETHGSFEAYRDAKLRFFIEAAPAAAKIGKVFIGVVNGESPHFKSFEEACPGPPFIYGIEPRCDVRASGIVSSLFSVKFNIMSSVCKGKVSVSIPGRHNVFNALAAASAGMALGIPASSILKGLESLQVVSGRMERISSDERNVFIDYAHTSDALKEVLLSGREMASQSSGKLILVFGCGGDRDNTKRPRMGKIANELADVVYITSDNPRTEDPHLIIQNILSGIEGEIAQIVVEADRGLAIERAVIESSKEDIVIVAGKGHEDYQIFGNERIFFDDSQVALKAIEKL